MLGLGEEFADAFRKRYGVVDYEWGTVGASTDFVGPHHVYALTQMLMGCFFRGTCHTVCVHPSLPIHRADDDDDELQGCPACIPVFVCWVFVCVAAHVLTPLPAIPTVPGGGNHTREFERAASTDAAHEACYDVSRALAHVGMRVLTDAAFLARVCLD